MCNNTAAGGGGGFWPQAMQHALRARPALPLLLVQEIDGFGFALACNFLRELGYENFSKPDVHLRKIFWVTGLSPFGTARRVWCLRQSLMAVL